MSFNRDSSSPMSSMSPVGMLGADLDSALDVLNASMDSGVIDEMLDSRGRVNDGSPVSLYGNSPVSIASDNALIHRGEADSSLILKCQMVIDDLQKELDRERMRSRDLDNQLSHTLSDLDQLRGERQTAVESLDSLAAQLEELQRNNANLVESHDKQVLSLSSRLEAAEQAAERKDFELENMTRHFEKRLDEMKRQVKHATQTPSISAISTPPLPPCLITRRSPELEMEIEQMRAELATAHRAVAEEDTEIRAVVESYERQVTMLRQQLKSSKSYFKDYYATKASYASVA
jgi:chromosome segregation ATPase